MTKYERNYVRWYFRENRSKLLLIVMLLFIAMPLLSIFLPSFVDGIDYFRMPLIVQSVMLVASCMVLAYGFALYNYRYLMNKRSSAMYMAMPIVKSRFFILQYLLGLVWVFVIPMLMYGLAIFLDKGAWSELPLFLSIGISVGLVGIALYTMYIAIIMKCNNLWDACLVCLGYTILPLVLVGGIYVMMNSALSSTLISSRTDMEEVFPTINFLQVLSAPAVMMNMIASLNSGLYVGHYEAVNVWQGVFNQDGFSFMWVIYWLVLLGGLLFFAKRMYVKRGCERSEQITTAYLCYPFLSLLVAASFIMVDSYAGNFRSGNANVTISFTMVVVSFIVYLVMNFFARRKIQVTKGMLFGFGGVVVCVFSLFYVCSATKGFGQIQEFPIKADIASVSLGIHLSSDDNEGVNLTFDNPKYAVLNNVKFHDLNSKDISEPAIVDEIYALQELMVNDDNNDYEYLPNSASVNFYYNMKNGKRIVRGYTTNTSSDYETIKNYVEKLVDKGLCGGAEELKQYNQR